MKAVSQIISHALYIGMTILAISFLVIYMQGLKTDIEFQTTNSKLNFVSELVSNKIFDLYLISQESEVVPEPNTNYTIAQFEIPNPDYEIFFYENIFTARSGNYETNKTTNVNLYLSGKATTPAYLKLIRTNFDGDIIDIIEVSK